MKPTIVLVHGAFAESSSWNDVIDRLDEEGYRTIAAANPLRGVAADAESITALVRSIEGPVVLVGHSYGGAVISSVDPDAGDIRALVFVAGFAPDKGDSAASLSGSVPGSTLGDTLNPVPLADGGTDLYIDQAKFHDQFCADLPADQAARMAATQRPITEVALGETTATEPLWRRVPSWFIFGDQDRNIPPQALASMAERAESRRTEAVEGASHSVGVSHADKTSQMILEAAGAASGANL